MKMQYVDDVRAGRILAGRLVRLAVERHQHDLARARRKNFCYAFDEASAARAIQFFRFLRHSKGEWAGQPLELSPWQQFIVASLFGWRRKSDGLRRFRSAYIEVARKNGKSTFAAGLALYLMLADGEPGAEVYAAATTRDQARIVHGEAVRMVQRSPELARRINIFKDTLLHEPSASRFQPLCAAGDRLDGLNVHAAIIDEYHAHKTRELFDVLDTATAARRQPLLIVITTAGYDRTSPCWALHDYCRKVLEGEPDETQFCYIATLDEEDDWNDSTTWIKANPNLGVSVKLDDLARKAAKAEALPAAQNEFRTKHVNQWVSQISRFIPVELWDQITDAIDPDTLAGQSALVGLDLAKSQDVAGYVLLFGDEEAGYEVLPRFWIPEARALERERDNRIRWRAWESQGLVTISDGEVIDYALIEARLLEDARHFQIEQVAYDPWNCLQFALRLAEAGLEVVEFPQTIKNFNEPTRKLIELVRIKKLRHGGHAVLRWMADNVEVRTDASGNIRPVKPTPDSPLKIDGIVMLIMALGLALRRADRGGDYDGSILAL
jgi:phage terminase large subunit-like protein